MALTLKSQQDSVHSSTRVFPNMLWSKAKHRPRDGNEKWAGVLRGTALPGHTRGPGRKKSGGRCEGPARPWDTEDKGRALSHRGEQEVLVARGEKLQTRRRGTGRAGKR